MNTNRARRAEAAAIRAWMTGTCDGYQCDAPATVTYPLAEWMADHPIRWEFCDRHATEWAHITRTA